MAGQQRIKRFIQSQPWVNNGQITFQNLPRNYDLETLFVRVSGDLVITAALPNSAPVANPPGVRFDAPFGILSRVELIAEGRQTIFSLPATTLGMANMWRRRSAFYSQELFSTYNVTQRPPLNRDTVTPLRVSAQIGVGAVQTGTTPFSGVFALDLQSISGLRPKDSNFRTGGLQTFELRLQTLDATALFFPQNGASVVTPFNAPVIGGTLGATLGTVATIQNATVEIFQDELQELLAPGEATSMPGYLRRFSHQDVPISAANNQLEIQLPTDNYLQSTILHARIGGEGVDNVITNVQLRRGVDVRVNLTGNECIAMNEADYVHQRFPGFYILDPMTSGGPYDRIADAWNLQGGADTRLVLAVQNPGANVVVGVTSVEYIPLRAG